MAAMDLLVSGFTLWVFVLTGGNQLGIKHLWVYVVLTLGVGVCFALPLFLYMREGKLVERR